MSDEIMNGSADCKPTGPPIQLEEQDRNFGLKKPQLQESEKIGLVILCSGHPTNFIFQPAKYLKDLDELEAAMSDFYNKEEIGLTVENPIKNRVYATCDADNVWYRVVVVDSEMSNNRVPVRLCDYGEIALTHTSSLRKLTEEFRKHPFMAMKGQLAGLRPLANNWSLDDSVKFKELVENQYLAGVVVGIHDNKVNPMDSTVYLNLFHVRDDGEVDIAELLVRENVGLRDG